MADDQTAGTQEPDGTDAAEKPTSGTQATDDRNADNGRIEGTGISKEEALGWKAKAERTNAVEARLAELEERLAQSPAAPGSEGDPRREREEKLRYFAQEKDPVAMEVLELRAMLQDVIHENGNLRQIDRIPDVAERDEVLAHFSKNRHRLADWKAAKAEVRERKLDVENERLRAELKRRETRNDPDVVRTVDKEVTASEHKTKMTQKQWDQEQASLSPLERMKRQNLYNQGKIEVE